MFRVIAPGWDQAAVTRLTVLDRFSHIALTRQASTAGRNANQHSNHVRRERSEPASSTPRAAVGGCAGNDPSGNRRTYRWYRVLATAKELAPDTCIDWRRVGGPQRRDFDHRRRLRRRTILPTTSRRFSADPPVNAADRNGMFAGDRRGAAAPRKTRSWLGRRSQTWIENTDRLRRKSGVSIGTIRHIVFYQIIQERATQVAISISGWPQGTLPRLQTPVDESLSDACRLISVDEAAHYHFFVETARLLLRTGGVSEALVEVLRHFTMPARCNRRYDVFGRVRTTPVCSDVRFTTGTLQVVLATLSAPALRQLEEGVSRSRIPCTEEFRRTAARLLNPAEIENKVSRLFDATPPSRAGPRASVRCRVGARLGIRASGMIAVSNPVWSTVPSRPTFPRTVGRGAPRRLVASARHRARISADDGRLLRDHRFAPCSVAAAEGSYRGMRDCRLRRRRAHARLRRLRSGSQHLLIGRAVRSGPSVPVRLPCGIGPRSSPSTW